jgi:PAS domain S-box-containing protein
MIPVDPSSEEARRLEVLRQYGVLDTPPEQALDELVVLAAQICNAPIALISLVDDRRQWFKARVGQETRETPREISFCAHALRQTELLIVPDATADERFAGNPLVTGEPHIRFYAGAPLVTPEGPILGTLCVIDRVPRVLTPEQECALQVLSRQAMSQLELRRQGRELQASEAKLRAIFEAEPECVKLLGPDTTLHEINAAGLRLIEAEKLEMVNGRRLMPIVVPEDRETVSAALAAVAGGERRTLQFRILGLKGTLRWLEMTAVPFHDGQPDGNLILSVSHDVTARKEAEDKIRRLNRLYAVSSAIN